MGFHTFDPSRADRLEDVSRYRFCSREELLGALDAGSGTDDHLIDLGSGTGFYTADLAPFFGRVSAVDIQAEMHELFRENGVPDNVDLVESSTDSLPLGDGAADAAVSTMTAHEIPLASTLTDLRRVLAPDSPVVVVDWSADGRGEAGPPRDERHDADFVADAFTEAGFSVEVATERGETFSIRARS
ncbi:class I SAM-dependent methyltransferase [Halonotius terrestris]|uniref:Class I SAM-dependent methyltransferase n=1 Tax=Halonotius terrestris TaxID=2487750 RepID=A0A8J8PDT3_9EURY|nr:class I SAM-dependent methyltransferase [Halonotius terrestris]TQQ83296.1 class I SAM-dependent methyltransferase [Halonotius terrestris]